ncbi:leucine--tRNA ligase [Flexivirga endophytica]|uniref:Leucine--tRNA ligase n=1 Tax=Flexivirga endophytica TaxID=1849103 RepID=A0A916STT9_9MICO|nr:leucine--tRNA ligase [Flexivirga endophytica]GGB17686.1 leucine--tRNA ligase [Flexivirga endophytica]GHB37967.1 leucine--tRNA ligase [Flexivirga endophytica]
MTDEQPAHRYTPALANEIERSWQDHWEEHRTFEAPNPAGPWADPQAVGDRPKFMVQDMFPYPSGDGLHVGHPLPFIATDVYARYQRMTGKNVLYTQGFDAFGLPAEQYAVKTGQHPRKTTEDNIVNFTRQVRMLGLSHDPRRKIQTIDPGFYKWTQWIFTKIYNAWYDDRAGKARPIEELTAAYESGDVPTPNGRPWSEQTDDERCEAIDSRRLAYKKEVPVNWAPGLGTVVANEEVTNEGLTERGDMPVFQRSLSQWMMRITAYADRLADDLDRVDWTESIKVMQRNWIGRSHGASIEFAVDDAHDRIEVFTTRPDTIFGATFMVLAPEHPLVDSLAPAAWPDGTQPSWTGGADTPREAVSAYRLATSRKSELERQTEDAKAKSGVFTGAFATNPVSGERVPVFIADYVLMGYGTGAVMAVPAEDPRDWDFAKKYDLPHVRTVQPAEGHDEDTAYTGHGPMINSSNDRVSLDGKDTEDAKQTVIDFLESEGVGRGTVTYKLRDWLFSRQRYWGEPFPIVYDEDGVAHALPESMLPVELPDVADYSPKTYEPDDAASNPESPLSRATEWVDVELDLGDGPKKYRRETDTMPNWAGSCWYELRYTDPANSDRFVDPEVEQYWMGPGRGAGEGVAGDPGGVDLYVGGPEHAVLHLLYARFWHKVLFDLGEVSSEEPFRRLFIHGYVQAYAFRDGRGQPVPAAEVVEHGEGKDLTFTWNGAPVSREYGKMGKSLKNVVTPDEMSAEYGADTFRVFEMSMGPLDISRPWETRAVVGSQRFLQRLWRNVIDEETGELRVSDEAPSQELGRALAKAIDGVGKDYESLQFNTAIAKLIELNNALTKASAEAPAPRSVVEPLVLMTAPVAPHIAEELWSRLGHESSLSHEDFPVADESMLVDETVTCVVQVQGKVRDRLEVSPDISDADLEALARASEKIAAAVGDKQIRKVIVRAPKLVNLVVG